ncbi:MAG: N-acetyltransferase [Planctomycetota bacterium]
MLTIRPERSDDAAAIHEVHRAAFPTEAEAKLVDRLRENGHSPVSLVAEEGHRIVGHVLFSPVTIAGMNDTSGLGLAPIAVIPTRQRQGVGSRLIEEGLAVCRRTGVPFVVVLGDPAFYHRFGFQRASTLGLSNEYGVDDEFMVLELSPNAIPAAGGLVTYGPEFALLAE